MTPGDINLNSKFPYLSSVADCGYCTVYGSTQLAFKGGKSWIKDFEIPEWHFTDDDFMNSIVALDECKAEDSFNVCNEYLRDANYKQPGKTNKKRTAAKAWNGLPGRITVV